MSSVELVGDPHHTASDTDRLAAEAPLPEGYIAKMMAIPRTLTWETAAEHVTPCEHSAGARRSIVRPDSVGHGH